MTSIRSHRPTTRDSDDGYTDLEEFLNSAQPRPPALNVFLPALSHRPRP